SVSLRDFRELLQIVTVLRPDEIYNLAGQSSVGLSFAQPIETMESIAQAELLLLEVIRYLELPTRLYNAGSSECFGDQPRGTAAAGGRAWGYGPEYVEAMWSMLQRDEPDDFVIATGEAHTIAEFAAAAFAEFDLDAAQHIDIDETLFRPSDISWSRGTPAKAERVLGWTARTKFSELVKILCEAEK